ncbi:methyltransferase domain-containing protein [Azospirillum cavernae]|uniref:Methyltransferase domain-containing protein n=1 Tax=Azospirillum cavernae TaxID=2320860 RepID=A0A418VL36_9PROT|nr:methyltransferase domain-containing protein [Azospirillum cavernae]RJF76867.1 methyltransferase domain-containing protein [Azospirillum cavernae]
MAEIDLLRRYPRARRNLHQRHAGQTPENIRAAREFGFDYFDGPRECGYGGYRYDGRWLPIAEDIVAHFHLRPGDRVLDVGCAKGFLVKDLMTVCPGLEAFGLDVSSYALKHCEPGTVGRLHLGNAVSLPFPDNSFSAVLAINTLHNLDRAGCIAALQEMERVAPGRGYVQVDSYRDAVERQLFLDWVLTAETHYDPDGWKALFAEAGYRGDHYWTIIEAELP